MTTASNTPARTFRRFLPVFALLGLVGILLVPVHLALNDLGWNALVPSHLIGTCALLVFLALLPSLVPRWLAGLGLTVALAVMLIVRLFFHGLVQFSGAGFTHEVFIHLEPQSFAVAWEQYRLSCLLLLALLACIPFLAWNLANRLPRLPRAGAWLLAVLALACAGWMRAGLPERMLASEIRAWVTPKRLDLPETELKRWRESGLVEVDLPAKSALRAKPANPPRNLVLVYLESLGQRVIEHPDYPNLMPNLARRVQLQSLLRDYFAASFITIEGMTNSQCGTLFPFDRGSESIAGFDGMAEEQICLGDVLHRAGYAQSFLGGAESSFAGKGHFLAAHGFDRVLGFDDWQKMGYAPRPGGWGLGDPDLFEQAFAEIERLRTGSQPFNLTLLTIGSHLPGFSYEECAPYGSEEPFIEALHCTDQLLERFLARIEAAGYLDDTTVVVTADHHVFPNPLMKRLFGAEAINDLRLPLVVLGDEHAAAAVASGANYDLAPTVLDLLGIQSDARFALGRSALRPESARSYFPSRYQDIHEGVRAESNVSACGVAAPALPLGSCDKEALMTLMRMQNARFSLQTQTRLDCAAPDGIRIRVPDAQDEAISFFINGTDEAARFTWKARSGQETKPGLFIAAFSPEGELLDRLFVREQDAPGLEAPIFVEGADHYLIAWRGREGTPPPWFGSAAAMGAAVRLIDAHGQMHPLVGLPLENAVEFTLATDACTLWEDADAPVDALKERLLAATPESLRLPPDSPFCPILQWGPQEVFAGERFNPQPDGSSAFWLKTECVPQRAMLGFDGHLIETVRQLPIITVAVNADAILRQAGEWPLELYDPNTRQLLPIGTLRVKPPRAPITLSEPVARSWPAVPSPISPPALIAHAGGAWQGMAYLNSREALSHNYALGHRVFELDFSWTSDGQLVLIHDWGSTWQGLFPHADHGTIPDHATFLDASMKDGQTPLDLARLREWMQAHPDAYVVTDIHGQDLLGLQRIKQALAPVQNRIIPQMFHAYRYPEIRALGYEQIIFSLYGSSLDTESLIEFIRKTPLFAVTLNPEQRPDAERLMAELGKSRIPVYVHTFNEPDDLARFRALGAHGLYTDFLYPPHKGEVPSRQ
ncbi:MAG: sulfatase-like hydrolase/transferase [Lysobacteraceae bacterium]